MMVIYVPVKFELNWTDRFGVRVQKRKCRQTDGWTDKRTKQEGQRCPKSRVAQAAIRLATIVITFRNKERNVRLPS